MLHFFNLEFPSPFKHKHFYTSSHFCNLTLDLFSFKKNLFDWGLPKSHLSFQLRAINLHNSTRQFPIVFVIIPFPNTWVTFFV